MPRRKPLADVKAETDAALEARYRSFFTRWLADRDTWIGVFENHDLGHPDCGRRVAFPFAARDAPLATIGSTHAPDSNQIGLGWRYLLVAKCRTVDAAWAEMNPNRHLDTAKGAQA